MKSLRTSIEAVERKVERKVERVPDAEAKPLKNYKAYEVGGAANQIWHALQERYR